MLLKRLKALRHKGYLWHARRLPLQENKIILWADSFRHFGCSPKYIARSLAEQYPGTFDIVWVFDASVPVPEDLPAGIRVVRYFSMEYLKEISTAKCIICNNRTGPGHYFDKREGQVYIQTWHSSLRLKKIEGDTADTLPRAYIEAAKADSAKIDLLLSGCRSSTEMFRRAFWYDGEILEGGTPRCDLFFARTDGHIRQKVFCKYGLDSSAKLALYAPTFRDSKRAQTHGMDFAALKAMMEQKTGGPWVVGYRLHPNIHETMAVDGAISMTEYPDMQELLAAADCLITDYSSCMFDMAIAGKPCVLYAPDQDEYAAKERGLYFDLEELPFDVAANMDELRWLINDFDHETYQMRVRSFMAQIGSYEDGHATERVCEYILKKCGPQKESYDLRRDMRESKG